MQRGTEGIIVETVDEDMERDESVEPTTLEEQFQKIVKDSAQGARDEGGFTPVESKKKKKRQSGRKKKGGKSLSGSSPMSTSSGASGSTQGTPKKQDTKPSPDKAKKQGSKTRVVITTHIEEGKEESSSPFKRLPTSKTKDFRKA